MKILILCAGIGSRLGSYTSSNPKCLVKVNLVSILDRLLNQLHNLGLNNKNIFLCGGYKHELLPSKYKIFINKDFLTTNMMRTTIVGLDGLIKDINLNDKILIIYGDCLYSNEFISKIISSSYSFKEITIPVDLDWNKKWGERYENIYEDAETLEYDKSNNKLISIGRKTLIEKQYMAQFMGIYCIPKERINKFISKFKYLPNETQNKISTTEFFQKTINDLNYYVIPDKYIWTEIDTIDDLLYAKKIFV